MDDDFDIYGDLDLLPIPSFACDLGLKRKCSSVEALECASKHPRCPSNARQTSDYLCTKSELANKTGGQVKRREQLNDQNSDLNKRQQPNDRRCDLNSGTNRTSASSGVSHSSSTKNSKHHLNSRSSTHLTKLPSDLSRSKASGVHPNSNESTIATEKKLVVALDATKSPPPPVSTVANTNSTAQSAVESSSALFGLNELLELEQKYKSLEHKYKQLECEQEAKTKVNQDLNRKLTILKTNISSLYKTAKSEIDRKSQQIRALQSEIDTLKFRRQKRADEKY